MTPYLVGFFIAAALWAPLSFFLHCVIHELAHGLVAKRFGVGFRIEPWPQRIGTRFVWALTRFDRPLPSPRAILLVGVAPLAAELVWYTGMFAAACSLWWPTWLAAIVLVELVSAAIDCTTWVLGWWLKRESCDAEQVLKVFGWGRARARWLSLLVLPLYAGAGWQLWRILAD